MRVNVVDLSVLGEPYNPIDPRLIGNSNANPILVSTLIMTYKLGELQRFKHLPLEQYAHALSTRPSGCILRMPL